MSIGRPASETELARHVVAWLTQEGWDVYQEVAYGGPRADIVATRGAVVYVVECKMTLSLALIEQALHWQPYAHMVSMAVPLPKRECSGRGLSQRLGLGILTSAPRIHEEVHPEFRRPSSDRLRQALRDGHKTFAPAGNAEGRYFSSWQHTCQQVARWVAANPGKTLRELLAAVPTHYKTAASARGALAKWIELGKVPGVRLAREGRAVRLEAAS